MKLGSSRAMDTKRPRGSERSKPCHELQLTRPSQPPYPWRPEQAQSGVSKPYRTTVGPALNVIQSTGWYPPFHLGGTEVYLEGLIHGLSDLGVKSIVVMPRSSGAI